MQRPNITYNKMKSLIYELTKKNDLLNKNNIDLNVKILSLTRLIQIKDNQINLINNIIIKKALKNILLKKYIKENKLLLNAFTILKYYKKKKYLQPRLFYDHEIFFYILKTNKNNSIEKGIGDYNIKYNIRKQICLTLLKKRKYNTINQNDIFFNDKTFYSNNYKIFENISPINNINNIFIKRINNNNINNKCNDYKIEKNINFNIINNFKKNNNFDFSVSHLKIISNKKNFFENKNLSKNKYNFSFIYNVEKNKNDDNVNDKIDNDNEYIKKIEIFKNELNQKNKNIEEIKNINKKNDLEINNLINKITKLQEELNIMKYENILYKEVKNKNNKKKVIYSITKTNFNIISKKINKIIDKIKYKETKTNFNIISKLFQKENINNFINLSKSNIIYYNINPLLNIIE